MFPIVLVGIFTVVLFDVVASIASYSLGFNYAYLFVCSLLIYGSVGYFIAADENLKSSILSGFIVGLTDATVGWTISSMVGVGVSIFEATAPEIVLTAVIVSMAAAFIAFAGGSLRHLIYRKAN